MSRFAPTHRITVTPVRGEPAVTEVMLCDDGSAYSRAEYDNELAPSWAVDDGEWRHEGNVTPGGANGTVEVVELTHAGTSICVELHQGVLDPQGLATGDEVDCCEKHILAAVREAFPGADVRAVGRGGRTSGLTRDGEDITRDVRDVVEAAFDSFDW